MSPSWSALEKVCRAMVSARVHVLHGWPKRLSLAGWKRSRSSSGVTTSLLALPGRFFHLEAALATKAQPLKEARPAAAGSRLAASGGGGVGGGGEGAGAGKGAGPARLDCRGEASPEVAGLASGSSGARRGERARKRAAAESALMVPPRAAAELSGEASINCRSSSASSSHATAL